MNYKYFAFSCFFLIGLSWQSHSQSEQILINLTNPKQPGKLSFSNYKGSIEILGYSGDVIIVESTPRGASKDETTSGGLKKIPTNGFKLTAEEDNNQVVIRSNTLERTVDFTIKVPTNFSLQLKTIDNGRIVVKGVSGTIEITNINGDISIDDITGSAVLNSVDGNIKAVIKGVEKDSPMAFTSVQGKIEVFLPITINAVFKMKSEFGEIFSDFDIVYEKRKPTIKKKNSTSITTLDDWTIGKVNGGGPEYLFSTLEGNIYITKR